jgi:hydrogenase nickel incorporation protein HypA/HybF
MHEVGLCRSLLRMAERTAAEHGACRIVGVTVRVGPLAGVDGAQLARAFEVVRVGTIAEGAHFTLQTPPLVVRCARCGADSNASPGDLRCLACGSANVRLTSGDQLDLLQVELAEVENEAA